MRAWSKDGSLQALDLLRPAIARDPAYAPALAMASWCLTQLYIGAWVPDLEGTRREALDFARRAVDAGPDDPVALAVVAGTVHSRRDTPPGRRGLLDPAPFRKRGGTR